MIDTIDFVPGTETPLDKAPKRELISCVRTLETKVRNLEDEARKLRTQSKNMGTAAALKNLGLPTIIGDENLSEDKARTIKGTAEMLIKTIETLRHSNAWKINVPITHTCKMVMWGARIALKQLGFDELLDVHNPDVPDDLNQFLNFPKKEERRALSIKPGFVGSPDIPEDQRRELVAAGA